MAEDLRRYITNSEITDYVFVDTPVDELVLRQAQRDIDNVVAKFYQGNNRPFLLTYTDIDDCVLTTITATSNQLGNATGYYSKAVLEIMSGKNAGKRIYIASSENNSGSSVLTFGSTQTGLTGTVSARVYQEGKFPRSIDVDLSNTAYLKVIPEFLKECVALQYKFRIDHPEIFNDTNILSGYSVNKGSWSKNYDTKKERQIKDFTDPTAFNILADLGLTTQTLY
jgi:hypothetical protein